MIFIWNWCRHILELKISYENTQTYKTDNIMKNNEVEIQKAFAFDMGKVSSLISGKTKVVVIEAETPSVEGLNIRYSGQSIFLVKDRLIRCMKGPEERPIPRIW